MNRSWYSNKIDLESPDAVHQILVFGTLDEIRSLRASLGEEQIKELFLNYPKKIYTQPALNFIKNFILNITNTIDDAKYLKNTPRSIR